jgi:hypothetical protein
METIILKEILFDDRQHWDTSKQTYEERIRPIVIKEVEKFRDCGDMNKDLNSLIVKVAIRRNMFSIDAKDVSVQNAQREKVKNRVVY